MKWMENSQPDQSINPGKEAGHLEPGDPTYVRRDADDQLRQFIQTTDFCLCFILAPRQMGKTSLVEKTVDELNSAENILIKVSMQGIVDKSPDLKLFYITLLREISNAIATIQPEFGFEKDYYEIITKKYFNRELSTPVSFKEFILKEILKKISNNSKIVIFLDEIHLLLHKGFQNDVFALLRDIAENNKKNFQNKLKFVLLGVAKPSDLINKPGYAFNNRKIINLTGLQIKDCQEPLGQGLEIISDKPEALLQEIVDCTGGQPFLVQRLRKLAIEKFEADKIKISTEIILSLIEENLIKNYLADSNQDHFFQIKYYFERDKQEDKIQEKLAALSLYKRIFNQENIIYNFEEKDQMDLIISGLVSDGKRILSIANTIYKKVFNLEWCEEQKSILQNKLEKLIMSQDSFKLLENHDIYMLIDYSASMTAEDAIGEMKRWDSLRELIIGHVNQILENTNICSSISVHLFGWNYPRGETTTFKSGGNVIKLFDEFNKPDAYTFVFHALKNCLDKWLNNQNNSEGAFFIIYTDGEFSDRELFEQLIRETCLKIEDERLIKIIVIGIGKDVKQDYFNQLDNNSKNNVDKNGKLCDIVVFELWSKYDSSPSPSILEIMERELKR